MISGIVVILLMSAFIGIVWWAWSARRREDFARAAQMPLTDDAPPCCARQGTDHGHER